MHCMTPPLPRRGRPPRGRRGPPCEPAHSVQRALIRSWEYIRPVRISVLIVRLLVALWLVFLGALLMSGGYVWGWTLLPAAVAVFAIGLWVFNTAGKGWPVER